MRRLVFGGVLACVGVFVGCSSAGDTDREPNGEPPAFVVVEPEPEVERIVLATFNARFDPSSPTPLRFFPEGYDADALDGFQGEFITSGVQITGPGVWDPNTQTLTADPVTITNPAGTPYDEPEIRIASLTGEGAPDVAFQGTDFNSGTQIGARYAYTDLDSANHAPDNDAHRKWVVSVPGGKSFDFTVTVVGYANVARLEPDRDDDYFNVETTTPQGGDCDDTDPNVYPGSGTGYSSTCSNSTCVESCYGQCGACNFSGDTNANLTTKCYPGSTCDTVCVDAPPAFRCTNGTCSGATCGMECLNTPTCWQSNCVGGAQCDMDCTNATECKVNQCKSGSTCNVNCTNAFSCDIRTCTDSTCNMDCSSTSSNSRCYLNCGAGSQCVLQCGPNIQSKYCKMDCPGGATVCPSGAIVCGGAACPP